MYVCDSAEWCEDGEAIFASADDFTAHCERLFGEGPILTEYTDRNYYDSCGVRVLRAVEVCDCGAVATTHEHPVMQGEGGAWVRCVESPLQHMCAWCAALTLGHEYGATVTMALSEEFAARRPRVSMGILCPCTACGNTSQVVRSWTFASGTVLSEVCPCGEASYQRQADHRGRADGRWFGSFAAALLAPPLRGSVHFAVLVNPAGGQPVARLTTACGARARMPGRVYASPRPPGSIASGAPSRVTCKRCKSTAAYRNAMGEE